MKKPTLQKPATAVATPRAAAEHVSRIPLRDVTPRPSSYGGSCDAGDTSREVKGGIPWPSRPTPLPLRTVTTHPKPGRAPPQPVPLPIDRDDKPAAQLVSTQPIMLRPLHHGGSHALPGHIDREFLPRSPTWIDPRGIRRAPPYVTTPAVPVVPVELEQRWDDRTMLEYPNGHRINGVFDETTSSLIVGWVEALAWERQFRFVRLHVRPDTVSVDTAPTTGLIGPRPTPRDILGVGGLRSNQCALAPTLVRPALFPVVLSPGPGWPTTHYIVEIGADEGSGAAAFELDGLSEPVPAPAGIAFGRVGARTRIAFAYARRQGSSHLIEFGFLSRELNGWRFQPSVNWEVTPPGYQADPGALATSVEDNVAVAFDELRGEWMVAWVPGTYHPGAFVRRITFDGLPRGLPILAKEGSGDGFVGHGGVSLVQNPITGRFLLALSHNAVRLESRDDMGQIHVVTNGGADYTPGTSPTPSTALESADPTEFRTRPDTSPPGRGRVWAIAPCHTPGFEFRLGGEIRESAAGESWVCSYPGPGFDTRSEGRLWMDLPRANIHSYVSIPTYAQYAALIVAPVGASIFDYPPRGIPGAPYVHFAHLFVSLIQDAPSP